MTQHKQQQQQPAWKQYLYRKDEGRGKDAESKTADEQLAEDSMFFRYMLDLVPPNFYFNQEAKDRLKGKRPRGEEDGDSTDSSDEEEVAPKKSKGKRKKESVADPAELSRQKKKAKYDPLQARTVTQMQQELMERTEKKFSSKKKSRSSSAAAEFTVSGGGVPGSTEPGSDLREKLRLRLQEMQAKRKATEYIDRIEKKKQKRRDSKKRLKQKKLAEKQGQHQKGEKRPHLPNGMLSPRSKHGASPAKPIFNKEGKMVFSKFDFTDTSSAVKKTDLPTGSNYKQLLQKVERQKQKMEDLQHTDRAKAQKLKEKTVWTTALQKAEGVKVKDNPDLLKKAMKKKEHKKDKRKKEWKERTEKVDKHLQKQQDKRKKNIQKRKQQKVDKKIKKAKKKGRIIPGF